MKAILGIAVAPGLADRYLARNGYDAQQADAPVEPNRPDNLFEPVPGDCGARGPFDAQAKEESLQFELKRRLHQLVAAGLGRRRPG